MSAPAWLPPAGGYILAGGKSTRMGRNKALLQLGGETLVERAMGVLRDVCADVVIVGGGPEMERFARVIPDAAAERGPLGGIVAALEHTSFQWNAILAIDMPFVPASVLIGLLSWADGSDAVAVTPEVGGRLQPLCAVYSRLCATTFRHELEAGRWSVQDALKTVGNVDSEPFTEEAWFQNLNTPEDFLAAQRSSDIGTLPNPHRVR